MSDQLSLLVTIDQYAGNHERALSGYIFGVVDEHGLHYAEHTLDDWSKNVSEEDKDILSSSLVYRPVEEYGEMPYDIIYNENGECNVIEFFLSDWDWNEDKFVEAFKRRIGDGKITYKSLFGKEETVQILKVEWLFKIITINKEKWDLEL